ncbi:MAG: DNA polymerase I [Bacilli bacterium]
MENKLLLIDGNSIAYRAFFALPLLSNKDGLHTNAVYGFTNMLFKILEEEKPTHVLVAFDAGKTTFRHSDFEEYKGGRQKTPPELSEQFPVLRELLDVLGIQRYELENYEADDIIGTFASLGSALNWKVKVVSGDRDMIQLCSEHTDVIITRKGISETDIYTPAFLFDKYAIAPEQVVEMKGLMGDSSDNIPGVPGVGEKTALKLLHEYKTIEGIYENIDAVKGVKLKEKLIDNKELAFLSKKLATIYCETPVALTIDETKWDAFSLADAASFYASLGFKGMTQKLQHLLGAESGGEDQEESIEAPVFLVTLEPKLIDRFSEVTLSDHSPIYFWFETDSVNYHTAQIVAIGIATENEVYVSFGETLLSDEAFISFIQNEEQRKNVCDSKKVRTLLLWRGLDVQGVEDDLSLASYILHPSDATSSWASIVQREMPSLSFLEDEEIYGKGTKWRVPDDEHLLALISKKVYAQKEILPLYREQLHTENQYELYNEIELPLALILADMEYEGITVDPQTLQNMGQSLAVRIKDIECEIHSLAGETFNIGSPKQLGVILFEKLGLRVIKKTKTGYSTGAEILEELKNDHPIIAHILIYRTLTKLYSTYVEGLLKVIDTRTGKIHTRFNQTLTQTGRLSSVEPNLQNIPIRLEEGKLIRKAFVPSQEEYQILACDYSQIELRVLAHICKDPTLVEAFVNNEDVHTRTAMDVWGVEKADVSDLMRRQAKAVNFGIIYGISDFGLANNIDVTRKEAKAFIERYFTTFPRVKEFMDETVAQARLDGFVTTIYKRKRVLPDINNRNFTLRSFAERTAMNTPIQGSAADIIKIAMVSVAKKLKEGNYKTKMLLTVHDELVFEVPSSEIEFMKVQIPEWMEHAVSLSIPLSADVSYGASWYDAK